MDFNHTEERRMLKDSLARFLEANYSHEQRIKIVDAGKDGSPEVWKSFAELGVIGALFSEEQGGFGGGGFDIAVIFEELGRVASVEPLLQSALLGGRLLSELGTPEQKGMIEQIIGGELKVAFAHTEANNRYELDYVDTKVEAAGSGFVLNGEKVVVISGGSADKLIVSADAGGKLGLFIVDGNAKGVTRYSHENFDGVQAAEIKLSNVEVPAENVLGAVGSVLPAIETAVAAGVVALCAEALGAMEAAQALTTEYVRTRVQFGRAIGKFQALQHRLATVLVEIEQVRSAVINAAGNLEKEVAIRERNVSAGKCLVGQISKLVREEAIQMHGGIGMTEEYALSHFAKRLTLIDRQLGDADYHLERITSMIQAEVA
ncbi:acyl-CoA dehydrogenase family protein [Flexibacterium corallicola]|uniref:acyl-CoA dehydrogenase family protein n=1 Tax=Flexibacterium corallicola TaxID=3037259 RepID=UPI00286F1F45|nr:acyl-CoA dehydrogenase family protein [Pseudovibrio sp. M1P-2-3]